MLSILPSNETIKREDLKKKERERKMQERKNVGIVRYGELGFFLIKKKNSRNKK
jgi:hypothetical protein